VRNAMFKPVLLLLVAVSLVLAGCSSGAGDRDAGNSSTQKSGTAAAESGAIQHLRIGVQSFPSHLDSTSVSNASIQVIYNLYDTLIMRDPYSEEVRFLPGLALSWEQIDELTWEFRLRPDVIFHDGTIMTAEDVAYSMNRIIQRLDASYANLHSTFLANFEKFEVIDDLTVRAHTIKPEPLIENLLSDPNTGITSKAHIEKVGLDAARQHPITTGPYKVKEFVPDDRIVLERNDDFWGEKAPFETVTYYLIPEISSRVTAIANNEVDMVTNIPPDMEELLAQEEGVDLVGVRWPLYHVYVLNMNNPALDDPKIRQALDYAIDREALVQSLWNGKGEAATSLQFPEYGEPLYMPDIQNIGYDLEKAKRLIAESDYNGEEIEIYNTTNYYTYADLAAQAVIEMWKEIGVNGKLVQVDKMPETYDEVEMRTWSNPLYYNDPMGVMDLHWTDKMWPYTGGMFAPSQEFLDQLEIARYSMDLEKRVAAYRKLLELGREETPYILLYKPYEAYAMRNGLQWQVGKNYRPYTLLLRAGEVSFK